MKNFKSSAYAEQDRLEAEGKSDCWSARQPSIMPVIGDLFVGFNIEMLFQYKDQDRTSYANWCHGVVQSIVNAKTNYVCVKWNEEYLDPGEPSETKEKLLSSKWNPNKATTWARRQYFGGDVN